MKYQDLNEVRKHGTKDFPIGYYYVDCHHPQYKMQPHWHNEFEIIRVIQGQFSVFLNGTEYQLHSSDIILVEGGTLHNGNPKNCIYDCVVFDLNMLNNRKSDRISSIMMPLFNRELGINYRLVEKNSQVFETITAIFTVLKTGYKYYELDIYSLLLKFFSLLYKENKFILNSSNPIRSRQTQNVIKLIEWIDNNYTETINLNKLSKISGLNEKYICRIFKEYTSKSPINYINELRISAACNELAIKGSNITTVAFNCGFNELSYFSKVFKRFKGITPKEYQKIHSLKR